MADTLRKQARRLLQKHAQSPLGQVMHMCVEDALDAVTEALAARTIDDAPDARPWYPHLDYAGEPMKPGEFRDPPSRSIILEMAAASDEQEMWERRFGVLYRSHPSWRSADNDGSWGLRDFLAYVGDICGFDTRAVLATKEEE